MILKKIIIYFQIFILVLLTILFLRFEIDKQYTQILILENKIIMNDLNELKKDALLIAPILDLTQKQLEAIVNIFAIKSKIDPTIIKAIIHVESNWNIKARNIRSGARGLMQIMPQTAKEHFNVSKDKLFNPLVNIQLGCKYLKYLINECNNDTSVALVSYNSGLYQAQNMISLLQHNYILKYMKAIVNYR